MEISIGIWTDGHMDGAIHMAEYIYISMKLFICVKMCFVIWIDSHMNEAIHMAEYKWMMTST